ncbi:MAG: hypothetical protein GY906_23280 [bacterium]|nr:hypothetical protein [bacterium]
MTFFSGTPSSPTRFGEDVAAPGDVDGLFLKMFGGRVFGAFNRATITLDRHFVVSMGSGKSFQFPKTWRVQAEYHQAGQEMLGQTTDETERVITIDNLIVSHVGLYDLDVAKSHFQIRDKLSTELGRAIARLLDQNFMRAVILTARDSAVLGGGSQSTSPFPAGQVITSADVSGTLSATAGDQWWEAVRVQRVKTGENDIPLDDQQYVGIPFTTFDKLKYSQAGASAANPFLLGNRNEVVPSFNDQLVATSGAEMNLWIDGIEVLRSNLIPQTDQTADNSVPSKYRADYSATLGLGWHPDAVGTVKLINMSMETMRDVRRQEDFMVAKIAVGHGSLRNEGATEYTA